MRPISESWSVGAGRGWARVLLVVLAVAVTLGAPPMGAAAAKPGQVDPQVRAEAAGKGREKIRLLVQQRARGAALGAVRARGGEVQLELEGRNLVAVDLPADEVDALAADPGVVRVSVDAPMQSTAAAIDTSKLKTVFDQVVGATSVWNGTPLYQGTGVGVAILDSGLKSHGDFSGVNGTGVDPGSNRLIANQISISGQSSADDDYGHGTWVAGIVGGRGWGDSGRTDDGTYLGVAPDVNLIGVKVSDANGKSYASNVISGLEWVAKNKAKYNIRVANLSLVSSVAESYKTSQLAAAVELAWLQGVVVVVSAGNLGPNTALYPPANDPFVITVGATDDVGTVSTADDTLRPFSSYGTTQDGLSKPDLVAPGRKIVGTLYNTNAPLAKQFPAAVSANGKYITLSGTSAAAPIVTGVAALLLQARPGLTPGQVKWLLRKTAKPIAGAGTGAGYPQVGAAIAYTGTLGDSDTGLIPNSVVARAGCATLPTCTANGTTSSWDTVNWDTVNWDTVNWDTVNWDTSSWTTSSWSSTSWSSTSWSSVSAD